MEFLINNRRQVGSLMGHSGVGKSVLLQHLATNPPISKEVPSLQVVRTSLFGMREGDLGELAMRICGCRYTNDARIAWQTLRDYFRAAGPEGMHTVFAG